MDSGEVDNQYVLNKISYLEGLPLPFALLYMYLTYMCNFYTRASLKKKRRTYCRSEYARVWARVRKKKKNENKNETNNIAAANSGVRGIARRIASREILPASAGLFSVYIGRCGAMMTPRNAAMTLDNDILQGDG